MEAIKIKRFVTPRIALDTVRYTIYYAYQDFVDGMDSFIVVDANDFNDAVRIANENRPTEWRITCILET